jgi:hypothetical protein
MSNKFGIPCRHPLQRVICQDCGQAFLNCPVCYPDILFCSFCTSLKVVFDKNIDLVQPSAARQRKLEQDRKYYQTHKEKISEQKRIKYQANIQEEREKRRQYYQTLKVRMVEFPREAEQVRSKSNARTKKRYVLHREEIRQKAREKYAEEKSYRDTHREQINAFQRARYAARRQAAKQEDQQEPT